MPVTEAARLTISPMRERRLGGGEVGAHAGAQVAAGADVEHPLLLVAEQVDAGGVRQVLGEVPLAAHRRADAGAERLQLLERVHAQPAESLHQAVQHVDGGAGVGERPVVGRGARPEGDRERAQLAVRRVVAGDHASGEPGRVEDLEPRPRPTLLHGEVLEEADVERRVVRDEDAALGELEERRQGRLDRRGGWRPSSW